MHSLHLRFKLFQVVESGVVLCAEHVFRPTLTMTAAPGCTRKCMRQNDTQHTAQRLSHCGCHIFDMSPASGVATRRHASTLTSRSGKHVSLHVN